MMLDQPHLCFYHLWRMRLLLPLETVAFLWAPEKEIDPHALDINIVMLAKFYAWFGQSVGTQPFFSRQDCNQNPICYYYCSSQHVQTLGPVTC